MIILIAESKTMTACADAVTPEQYLAHVPAGEAGAEAVMAALAPMTAPRLAEATRTSPAMAEKLYRMIYDFPNKSCGTPAIEAYTGVVFKALGYASLSTAARQRCLESVRVLSSLYGVLRPADIVKAYRFDYTARLAPGDATFAAYWRSQATDTLLAYLREGGHTEVLDLLPADAARMIDWSRVERQARVCRVAFREIRAGGAWRTPPSNMLKTLRGTLLRRILETGTDTLDGAAALESDLFTPDTEPGAPGTITFLTARQ